ncbi:hypothetical protein DFH08DRAFT_804345 [Mycena albidolilacea]|uniref:Uncharacterized protein n=1 Tax=Mycena albidolilacea TaxID=1033008 RepID=A0AAD7EXG1_9AGAR|nr:hypothetical protein DFH08DRAFT_804345 [Mycena albidolilacea]
MIWYTNMSVLAMFVVGYFIIFQLELIVIQEVYNVFGKDFNFLKQHSLPHNMNTCVGEGFQQEVEKMYQKTNGKNAEHQIGLQDEREEVMARIKMTIDEWRRCQQDADLEDHE